VEHVANIFIHQINKAKPTKKPEHAKHAA
jgi:hypothetical protein